MKILKYPLISITDRPIEASRIIADNMLRIRPQKDVEYHPYKKTDVYYDKHLDLRIIDLKKLYPNARPGNIVYVDTVIEACVETDAKINFIGNAKVIFDGRVIFDSEREVSENGKYRCPIHLKEGDNPLRFMVRCDSTERFEFRFMPSVRFYWIWAKCYLLSARATSPIGGFRHEDGVGISRLYECEEPFDGVYFYPEEEYFTDTVDLGEIYESGNVAYALTYAKEDTVLDIKSTSSFAVYVNRKIEKTPVKLNTGDTVLLKIERSEAFSFEADSRDLWIPFLRSERNGGDKWLLLGGFENGDSDTPEKEIQFKRPYITSHSSAFWRFAGKDNYLRPYLSSRFFGQWHYTFMVGEYGLLNAYKLTGREGYLRYFEDHMRTMVEYFDYMRYEHEHFSSPSFLDISSTLHDLDSIGSIGRNLCEYYKITEDKRALHVIDTLLEAMFTNIPKFEDGTFHRPSDMWSDDTFMSVAFLVAAGSLKNDVRYHREAVRQLLGFGRKLFMEDEKLFSHIYFLDTGTPNRIPWGRGNGWVLVSMSCTLEQVAPDTEGYDELLALYREFSKGILANQDSDGLWHQVVNRKDSYSESSSTAMFSIGFSRGVRHGWLGEEYKEAAARAIRALLSLKIDSQGTVRDVCMGSGNARDVEYYMKLGTVENDDHGTGVILTALYEFSRLGA